MANYAYTENNNVVDVFDQLPRNWERYSNFHVLETDEAFLNSIGWYKIESRTPEYNSSTHKLGSYTYYLEDNIVIESREIIALPPKPIVIEKTPEQIEAENETRRLASIEDKWTEIRATRDDLMKDTDWRYLRFEREVRLELTPTDSLEALDTYMQALADITNQEDPFNITWPELV